MEQNTIGLQAEPRPEWRQYFLNHAVTAASRATCLRAKVGCVIVRDQNILATGYNGSPSRMPHCLDVGCLMYSSTAPDGSIEENCFRTIHAEINAIAQAAKNGTSIRGASLFITHSPCIHCLKIIVNVGIKEVVFQKAYKIDNPYVQEILQATGITFHHIQ